MKRIAVLFLLLPMLLFGVLARAAVPTVDQVQAEVRAGRYEQAESMMQEVVAARPESARARYVYAEILARTGKRDEAVKQVAEARRLDPAISFTDRAKFEQFEQRLQAGGKAGGSAYAGPGTGAIAGPDRTAATTSAAPAPEAARRAEAGGSSGIPSWIWLAGAVLLGVAVWRMMAARRSSRTPPMAATGMAPTGGYPGTPGAPGMPGTPGMPGGVVHGGHGYGYGPGMQPGMAPARGGPGMMGVGLGVAGGLAAGMLAERMLNGNEAQAKGADAAPADAGAGASGPGALDGTSGADGLSDQPVDFGHGAGWDSGGGESFDAGGDGGGGGGEGDGW